MANTQETAFAVMKGELCARCLVKLTEENDAHGTNDYQYEHDESFCKGCDEAVSDWFTANGEEAIGQQEPVSEETARRILTLENINAFEQSPEQVKEREEAERRYEALKEMEKRKLRERLM